MATNWIIPTLTDLAKVISTDVLRRGNENTDQQTVTDALAAAATQNEPPLVDPNLDDRATDQLDLAVKQFRGAIRLAGKQPLSITPGAVPPECFKHVLYLAAFGLVNATPSLQAYLMSDKGDAPLVMNFKRADEYLEKVSKGGGVVEADDPTGRDWLTAVNVPWSTGANIAVNVPNAQGMLIAALVASPYPAFDPTKPINLPIQPTRVGASSRPVDLTTYGDWCWDGGWVGGSGDCPSWFPVLQLGQP